jgi:hypothetical protein
VTLSHTCGLSGFTINTGVFIEGTNNRNSDCIFHVVRADPNSDSDVYAIQSNDEVDTGLIVWNCIFDECDYGIRSEGSSVVHISECDFIRSNTCGIQAYDDSLLDASGCIIAYNTAGVTARDESSIQLAGSAFCENRTNKEELDDSEILESNNLHLSEILPCS